MCEENEKKGVDERVKRKSKMVLLTSRVLSIASDTGSVSETEETLRGRTLTKYLQSSETKRKEIGRERKLVRVHKHDVSHTTCRHHHCLLRNKMYRTHPAHITIAQS
jgi:hypothetical protein